MIVFSDVDGTLLNSQHHILESSLLAMEELKKKNIPFVIVSGRRVQSIHIPLFDVYHFRCPIICCNGALILDENDRIVYSNSLTIPQAEEVLSFARRENYFDVSYSVYTTNHWVVEEIDERILWEQELVKHHAEKMSLSQVDPSEEAYKILFLGKDDEINRLHKVLVPHFPYYSIVKSGPGQLEVMNHGVNKATGIQKFLSLWNLPLEDSIAFGDSYNDLEMLEYVSTPVVMGNAPEELKNKIKNVTDDCDHDGIYHFLKKIKAI